MRKRKTGMTLRLGGRDDTHLTRMYLCGVCGDLRKVHDDGDYFIPHPHPNPTRYHCEKPRVRLSDEQAFVATHLLGEKLMVWWKLGGYVLKGPSRNRKWIPVLKERDIKRAIEQERATSRKVRSKELMRSCEYEVEGVFSKEAEPYLIQNPRALLFLLEKYKEVVVGEEWSYYILFSDLLSALSPKVLDAVQKYDPLLGLPSDEVSHVLEDIANVAQPGKSAIEVGGWFFNIIPHILFALIPSFRKTVLDGIQKQYNAESAQSKRYATAYLSYLLTFSSGDSESCDDLMKLRKDLLRDETEYCFSDLLPRGFSTKEYANKIRDAGWIVKEGVIVPPENGSE